MGGGDVYGARRTGRSSSTLEGKGVVALNETGRKEQVLKLPSGILISLVLGHLKVAGVAGVASREATAAAAGAALPAVAAGQELPVAACGRGFRGGVHRSGRTASSAPRRRTQSGRGSAGRRSGGAATIP